MIFKFLGGTFLMIGAVIGGGILAIPIVSAKFGFLTTLILIISAWALMTLTGLYILELSLSCPKRSNSYYSIVGKFLGYKIQALTSFLFLWLLYFSLSSYLSGCVSILLGLLPSKPYLSYFNISLIYVLVFGCLVVISAKIIIRLNVLFVMLKLSLLALVMFSASRYHSSVEIGSVQVFKPGFSALFLIVINSFGFQFIVPSMVSYYSVESHTKFKCMLITSTTIVLCLYMAWLYTIYAIVPLDGPKGLLSIEKSSNQLFALNASLAHYLHDSWTCYLLSVFESIALFGSFLCVSLGIFDFFVDIFKARHHVMIGFLTFAPPLILSMFSQNMYIYAMSAAGYIAIILEIIIPFWAKLAQSQRAQVRGVLSHR